MRFYHSRPSFGYIFESDASIFHLVKFQENIFLSTRIIFCCHMKVSCILFNDDDDECIYHFLLSCEDDAHIISCCHVKVSCILFNDDDDDEEMK